MFAANRLGVTDLLSYQSQQHLTKCMKEIQQVYKIGQSMQSIRMQNLLKQNLCMEKQKREINMCIIAAFQVAGQTSTVAIHCIDFYFSFLPLQYFVQAQTLHEPRVFHALSIHISLGFFMHSCRHIVTMVAQQTELLLQREQGER